MGCGRAFLMKKRGKILDGGWDFGYNEQVWGFGPQFCMCKGDGA